MSNGHGMKSAALELFVASMFKIIDTPEPKPLSHKVEGVPKHKQRIIDRNIKRKERKSNA